MKLKSIRICNFRSIEDESFEIVEKEGSYTYTLIGVNESGKSNILKAISLYDNGLPSFPNDYHNPQKPVEITFTYTLSQAEEKAVRRKLEEMESDRVAVHQLSILEVQVLSSFEPSLPVARRKEENLKFKTEILPDFTISDNKAIKKKDNSERDLDFHELLAKALPNYFWGNSHVVTIWKADSSHLINESIDLQAFALDQDVSVPLANCFKLAGLEDIPKTVSSLADNPAAISNLQNRLEDKVTSHIKKVWPDHPIKIRFQIDSGMISFLVEDEKVKYEAKTMEQRSDGFRQFISFLLTVSAESASGQLSNTLLLLDEPETFLHPQAQEHLKSELIRVTSDENNNIVLFATHSNYMIDKCTLDRCFRVAKKGNKTTEWSMIPGQGVSYAQVNYEVFGIPSDDYHNELYGYLEDTQPESLGGIPSDKSWNNTKNGQTEKVSLSKYIRNSIHHPENTTNTRFTDQELVKSIEILAAFKKT